MIPPTGRPASPRYMLPGPCLAWVVQGRDGRWYRVCIPCDVEYGKDHGHLREHDAVQSVRFHVRDMAKMRKAWADSVRWHERAVCAARAGDYLAFGRAIMRNESWAPEGLGLDSESEERGAHMADYLNRSERG